ncbi:MAG: (Fe-S)-binding protein [Byssovorax sp.]
MTPFRLPLLEPSRAALETCVYCPKLCRAACPVSNAEPKETLIPWGKMSFAYFAARGDVPVDEAHAAPAWACTACFACREACDHRNEVAPTLRDARAALFAEGAAPPEAVKVSARWAEHEAELARAATALETSADPAVSSKVPALVLLGCSYARRAPEAARDALFAVSRLLDRPVRPLSLCCGMPLLDAGDRPGFVAAATKFAKAVEEAPELVALDPGCAHTVIVEHPRLGVRTRRPELFVDLVARRKDVLARLPDLGSVRYHDPCKLGRGLGRYDEPRAVLAALTGKAPQDFQRSREQGECSGAGGLLPVTRPDTSRRIADARIAEHHAQGGGTLVTACAGSLHRFRSRGEPAVDLASLVARALGR